jgi:hypothetical protein
MTHDVESPLDFCLRGRDGFYVQANGTNFGSSSIGTFENGVQLIDVHSPGGCNFSHLPQTMNILWVKWRLVCPGG